MLMPGWLNCILVDVSSGQSRDTAGEKEIPPLVGLIWVSSLTADKLAAWHDKILFQTEQNQVVGNLHRINK